MTRRVLHVIPAVAARYGGPSEAVVGMCRALRVAGVETWVATTDADGPGRLAVAIDRPTTFEGIPAVFFRRRLSETFKWTWRLGTWLDAHVREFDVAHVHAVFSHSSIVAGRVCRQRGVPYVVRPLGTLDPWSVNRKWVRKQILFRAGVSALLKGAAAIHYTSQDELTLAEQSGAPAGKGVVVPLGIGEEFFAGSQPAVNATTGAPYFLALSRLDVKKGIDLLIRAFSDAGSAPGGTAWRLVIAGDGATGYVEHLRELARISPAASRIEFRGWVRGTEKVALMRGATAFVLPSHQENFGISVAEAMAAGVPAIVTPGVNLARDIEGAGAGWVVGREREAIASVLSGIMTDPSEARRRGDRARLLAARFHWAEIARQLVDMYDAARSAPATPVAVAI